MSTSTLFLVLGAGLAVLGLFVRWWAGRYDLKDAAISSAIQAARGKRSAENPTEIEARLREITGADGVTAKAKKAAGMAVGHAFAQVMGVVALAMMLAGLALVGLGWWWRT